MDTKSIITISRQYGSGGRFIGRKLANKLGIPFYDQELISLAAKESGFSEGFFENAEKKATSSFLYSLYLHGTVAVSYTHLDVYKRQPRIIEFMEELPKTISGKIKRAQIRQQDSGQEEPDIYGEDI